MFLRENDLIMCNLKFSIIVPIYNTEAYLNECLDSVINQTYDNMEIILVNDGSTDNSPRICEEYKESDSRVIVIHKENGGLSDARNIGLKSATGDYVIFVDSDDHIELDACNTFCSLLEASQHADIVLTKLKQLINGQLYSRNFYITENDTKIITGKEYLIKSFTMRAFSGSACCNIYKRTFLIDNNLYFKEGVFHEDVHWLLVVLLAADKVFSVDFTFYINRGYRPNAITTNTNASHLLKRAESLIVISYDLIDHISRVDDIVLKRLILNFVVSKFFEGFILGKFYKQVCSVPVHTNYFLLRDLDLGNKTKVVLFRISPMFCYLFIKSKNRLAMAVSTK